MFIDAGDLTLDQVEEIEKASMRLVTQAIVEYREFAAEIFEKETDKPADLAEDSTREALDSLGVSKIAKRLFGKIDYKRARYVFHPAYAVRQALFVDSKAESELGVARIQLSQTSMPIHYRRQTGEEVHEAGTLKQAISIDQKDFLVTTIFVKYEYHCVDQKAKVKGPPYKLDEIIVAAAPNGLLAAVYNPTVDATIWRTGPQSGKRSERFRARLVFKLLSEKQKWRVQRVPMAPQTFIWSDSAPAVTATLSN